MNVIPTAIPDVLRIEPESFEDDRGFFLESYNRDRFAAAGITCDFAQDNHSRSRRGTLRGLHYQRHPGQAKVMRVARGCVWDVAVDIRPASPTFGRWVAAELSDVSRHMLFVPIGFAHGFVVLSNVADVVYKCSHVYVAETEAGIAWDDPDIGIPWPVGHPVLSRRDQTNPRLREVFPEMFRG